MDELDALETLILRSLLAERPLVALERERESAAARGAAAELLEPIDAILDDPRQRDGFLLSALLIEKLRFDRIRRADPRMQAWFEADPDGFCKLVHEVHLSLPPAGFFPREEGAAFWQYYKRTRNVP